MYDAKVVTHNTAGPEQKRAPADALAMAMGGLYALLCEMGPEQWDEAQAAMAEAGVRAMGLPGLWPERAAQVRDALGAMHPGRVYDLAMAVARKIERHACE